MRDRRINLANGNILEGGFTGLGGFLAVFSLSDVMAGGVIRALEDHAPGLGPELQHQPHAGALLSINVGIRGVATNLFDMTAEHNHPPDPYFMTAITD